jgi:uncharacterized protein (DUF1330 family)
MSAYAISEVRPLDPDLFNEYRAIAAESIVPYNGRYIVRGGYVRAAEGTWPQGFALVITEFPTMDDLQRWYDSPEYARALAVRRRGALERRLVFAESLSFD